MYPAVLFNLPGQAPSVNYLHFHDTEEFLYLLLCTVAHCRLPLISYVIGSICLLKILYGTSLLGTRFTTKILEFNL